MLHVLVAAPKPEVVPIRKIPGVSPKASWTLTGMPKVEHRDIKPTETDSLVLPGAAREFKSGACVEAPGVPKGKELLQLVASGCGPSGDLNVGRVVSPGSKARLKFALGL